jgi:hypothetical protein
MLLQIKEATDIVAQLSELGSIFKILVALVLLSWGVTGYLFSKWQEEVKAGREREKETLTVLSATNDIFKQGIKDSAHHTNSIKQEIASLRDLLALIAK